MNEELRGQIYNNFNLKETDELLEIWKANNHFEWSDTAFEVLRELLIERTGEIPLQDEPVFTRSEDFEDQLKEWEEKLLDNENQPELYDTLEVLKLKDNIDMVANATIVVNIILGLLNLQFIRALLKGNLVSFSEIMRSFPNIVFTILSFGLSIAIVYFPLKALNQILRILMETEFNSRKAKS